MGSVVKGIGKALFGEEKKVENRAYSTLTPQQQSLLNALTRQIMPQIGRGVSAYPGETVEPLTPLQQALIDIAGGMGQPLADVFSQGVQMATETQPYDEQAGRQYWENAFVKPAEQQYWQEIVPQLAEKFAGANAVSSSGLNRALAQAAANMETGLGATLADVLYKGRESWLDRQLRRKALGLQATESALRQIGALSQLADIERQIGQAQKQEEYQKWLYSQPYQNPWLGFIGPALGTRAIENVTYTTGGSPGLLGSLLPAAGTAVGFALGGPLGGALGSSLGGLFSGGVQAPAIIAERPSLYSPAFGSNITGGYNRYAIHW